MVYTTCLVTEDEALFVRQRIGIASSGENALINCIFALDTPNRHKMALGFPTLVDIVNKYNFEKGYWRDLVFRYNAEYGTKIVP